MTALGQPAGQELVAGHEAGQEREAAEAGVAPGEQDQRGRRLHDEVHEVPVAPEHRVRFLGQDGRVAGLVRDGVGDVRHPGDARDKEGDNRALGDQDLPGVAALWRAERADRVGDRLDPGQRRSPVGKGLGQHVDQAEAEEGLGAVPDREGGAGERADVRQPGAQLADQADDDRQPDRAGEEVGRHREDPARLADAAQVAIAHEQHDQHRDHAQDVRADHRDTGELRERGNDSRRARRHLDRDRDHVVDQQRHGADLGDPRPEVLPGHDVGTTGPDVDHDDLAVGEHHEDHHEQDDQRHREDQGERGQARHRQEGDQDLLGAVRGGRDPVGRQHAEREGLGQPLLAQLLVDQWRPQQPFLGGVPEGL